MGLLPRLYLALSLVVLTGCASLLDDDELPVGERHPLAPELRVTTADDGRAVVEAMPAESVMERFDMLDDQGRRISYVAFTDTEVGGLVFIDGRLHGTVSREIAHAFFSCRGYATANGQPWGSAASTWVRPLLAHVQPADEVSLQFRGRSMAQSLKDLAGNAMVSQLRSLLDMGSNPLNVVRTAGRLRSDYKDRARYEAVLKGLRAVIPGQDEAAVASIARPEDVAFVPGGLVMAYQRFLVEFYLVGGKVQVIQQPSLHQLSRSYGGLFYRANARWHDCTPSHWPQAITALEHQRVPAYKPGPPGGEPR